MSITKREFEDCCRECGLSIKYNPHNKFKSRQECLVFLQKFDFRPRPLKKEKPYVYHFDGQEKVNGKKKNWKENEPGSN